MESINDTNDALICRGEPTLQEMANLSRLEELGKQAIKIDQFNLAAGRLTEVAGQMEKDAAAIREYLHQCAAEVDPKTGTTAWSSVASLANAQVGMHKLIIESLIPEQQRQMDARNAREKDGKRTRCSAPGAAVQINQTFTNDGKPPTTEVIEVQHDEC